MQSDKRLALDDEARRPPKAATQPPVRCRQPLGNRSNTGFPGEILFLFLFLLSMSTLIQPVTAIRSILSGKKTKGGPAQKEKKKKIAFKKKWAVNWLKGFFFFQLAFYKLKLNVLPRLTGFFSEAQSCLISIHSVAVPCCKST